jgi:serine/threonine protein kinase
MKMLDHENVAKFIELIEIEEKQKMYIVMELVGGSFYDATGFRWLTPFIRCSGGSLHTLLERMPDGRLPTCYCRWYFRQLINGIDYLHKQGVVHRDIKVFRWICNDACA